MPTTLVLDTSVLPQRGSVRDNPLLSALLRIAALKGFRTAITDVSRSESLNKRRTLANEAVERLASAIRNVGKIFGNDQLNYYLPSHEDAITAWAEDLDGSFNLLQTDGIDAVEALHREARRQSPARATGDGSATGSRDAAIWLSVKRLHLSSDDQYTYFVSSNSKDFSDKSSKSALHPELLTELGGSSDRFVYATSLDTAVDELADQAVVAKIDSAGLRSLVDATDMDVQLLEQLQTVTDKWDTLQPISLSVEGVTETRVYTVEATRLAQLRVDFTCIVSARQEDVSDPDQPVAGHAKVWVHTTDDTASFEIDSLVFADTPLKLR